VKTDDKDQLIDKIFVGWNHDHPDKKPRIPDPILQELLYDLIDKVEIKTASVLGDLIRILGEDGVLTNMADLIALERSKAIEDVPRET